MYRHSIVYCIKSTDLQFFQVVRNIIIKVTDYNADRGDVHTLYLSTISNGRVLDSHVKVFRSPFPVDGYSHELHMTGNRAPHLDLVAYYFDYDGTPVVDVLRVPVPFMCRDRVRKHCC